MARINVEQAMQIAVQHHRAGRLPEAEQFYREVLSIQPKHVDALHLLGVVAAQSKRYEMAIDFIRQAIAVNPSVPEFYSNLANACQAVGKPQEALAAFNSLGNLQLSKRRFAEAAEAFGSTTRLNPDFSGGFYNMGIALSEKGDFAEAIDAYRQALRVKPDFDSAYNNLGNALKRSGKARDAVEVYCKALSLNPNHPDAHNNLGVTLVEIGQPEQAIAAHLNAVRLKPDNAQFHYNLGIAMEKTRRLDDAILAYRQAMRLDPSHAEAHYNLAHVMGDKCDYASAVAGYEQAIRLKPQWAEPHYNLGITLLLLGNYQRGWNEYEWRWRQKDFPSPAVKRDRPAWDGDQLDGKAILLHAEQGLGDSVQFIRYAPLVAQRGGRVIVECAPELARLIASVQGVAEVVTKYPPPPFDVHCPLLSLPRLFGTQLNTIPADIPYMEADSADVEKWRLRVISANHDYAGSALRTAQFDVNASVRRPGPAPEVDRARSRMNIGLCWGGQPSHKNDLNRSFSLSQFAPLARAVDAIFYSLQKGPAAAQAAAPPADMELFDWTADLCDLADTAALISHMDLVITVDTVVAHLAGAMGKTVWVLIPFHPDWRWMLNREDNLWYPTMRLFRQNSAGDKADVIARVTSALKLGT